MRNDQVASCTHVNEVHEVRARTPDGCEECLQIGSWWVHLRLCVTCGHVAAATAHRTDMPPLIFTRPGIQ
jgi:hypothetical protein